MSHKHRTFRPGGKCHRFLCPSAKGICLASMTVSFQHTSRGVKLSDSLISAGLIEDLSLLSVQAVIRMIAVNECTEFLTNV